LFRAKPHPLKLAIVTETFPPEVNGVAMTFGNLAATLADRGHEITVWRPSRPELTRTKHPAGLTEEWLPGFPIPCYPLLRFGFPAWRRLRQAWTNVRPDLVHVVTEGPLGASAITVARSLQIPVTSSFHTNFHTYARNYGFGVLRGAALAWLRRVHNRTDRTFAPTAQLCAELSAEGFKNLAVLSRGVDTSRFDPARRCPALRARWDADENTLVVIHVGRIAAEKNFELLFRAYDAMASATPKIRFVVVGEGPIKSQLVRKHPNCIFEPFYSREEIGRFYASADMYVHTSLTETFGNVLIEAMASGLAVVGFDYAAARQFVKHGESGLVVARGEDDDLVSEAVRVALDAPLRAKLRSGARLELLSQSWEQITAEFERELVTVVRSRGAKMHRPSLLPAFTHGTKNTPVA
jgi:glycosyltransferase involved in cell wall biosynthesis